MWMSPPDSHWAILASTVAGSCVDEKVELCLVAVSPSAASVAGPATPSALRPCARWKRLSARRVCGPMTPSAWMPSARWIAFTETFLALVALAVAAVPPVPWAAASPVANVNAARHTPAAAAKRRGLERLDRSVGTRGTPWSHRAYGVSCRARAMTCATPSTDGDSPREPDLGSNRFPRSLPDRPGGTRLLCGATLQHRSS